MKRNPRIDDLSNENLLCFVQWCRLNDDRITSMPDLCRNVLKAYAQPAPKPKAAA